MGLKKTNCGATLLSITRTNIVIRHGRAVWQRPGAGLQAASQQIKLTQSGSVFSRQLNREDRLAGDWQDSRGEETTDYHRAQPG